ncbi:hypothetical protein BDF22DRAFT_701019 [Syncephalis plumigaleata]|nr:hypothetical protein BDF22DRAFT_701019 [Syncephalis plumigaleata]
MEANGQGSTAGESNPSTPAAAAVVPRRRQPSAADSTASHGTTSNENYMPGSMEFEMTLEYMRHSWASSERPASHPPLLTREEVHEETHNTTDAADRSGSSGHSNESETDSIADIAATSEAVRRLQRQVSFNQGSGNSGSGGSALLKKSVMNRAAEASHRLSNASLTAPRSFSPSTSPSSASPIATAAAASETGVAGTGTATGIERPRNVRSSSASSFTSSIHSGHGMGPTGGTASFHDNSFAYRYHPSPASIASYNRDSITQMTDITGKLDAHSIHEPIHTSPYLHLPLPDYDADDLEEEYYLRRRFAKELPPGALLFAFGFILCPLWWIGALLSIPGETATVNREGKASGTASASASRGETSRGGNGGEAASSASEPPQPIGQGTGEAIRHRAMLHRRWRLLNRIMSAISIVLIAATIGLLLWWYYRY